METLTDLVLSAFLTHWPRLKNDPAELAARLQRRGHALLNRPPRAWCIALRAGDTRITPLYAAIDEHDAYENRHPHTVHVTAKLVQRLCQPVFIGAWGEPATDVAAKLGVHPQGLNHLMRIGFFRARYVQGLGGKRGKPVPILHHDGPLDPQSRSFRPPLPAWGGLWQYHANAFRSAFDGVSGEGFVQPILREPEFHNTRWGDRFQGWVWRCPGCNRTTPKLYFPLPVPIVERFLNLQPSASEADACNIEFPLPTFACGRCHHVTNLSRVDRNSWNEFVTYLTAGLLYGREVPMPADWVERTNTKVKRPNARPAVRRADICRLLVETDLTRDQIAEAIGLRRGTINMHVEDVYKQFGVHSREALRSHPSAPHPRSPRVRQSA